MCLDTSFSMFYHMVSLRALATKQRRTVTNGSVYFYVEYSIFSRFLVFST